MLFKTTIPHKSGFVNIIGNSNVGKSTLMNYLTGEKLSIITHKAQTTRHKITGIVNTPNMQIIYSDTPGMIRPKDKLQKQMSYISELALKDADILLYVTDVVESPCKNFFFLKKIQKISIPILIIINKIDLSNQKQLEQKVDEWKSIFSYAEIIPLSALYCFRTDYLKKRIKNLLPESPPFFNKKIVTNRPARFFIAEFIREKIFLYYKQEIPYSSEVLIEFFNEFKNLIYIKANIIVERNTQKGIILGKKGSVLKKIIALAKREIEFFLKKNIYLETVVKVKKGWKDNDNLINFKY